MEEIAKYINTVLGENLRTKMVMEKYNRKALFCELEDYDHLAGEHDFIEVTEWKNSEGFDVEIAGKLSTRFQLTWGEYEALIELVEKLED